MVLEDERRTLSVPFFDRLSDAVVALVDGRIIERECLSYRLNSSRIGTVEFSTFDEAVQSKHFDRIELVLLYSPDIGEAAAQEMARCVVRSGRRAVVILSPEDDINVIVALIERGVRGYVPSSSTISDVIGAIQLVALGGTYIPASSVMAGMMNEYKREPSWKEHFTPKQAAIIECIRTGKPNKLIAFELKMCESTVKVHTRNVMRKLNVKNRTELAYRIAVGFAEERES